MSAAKQSKQELEAALIRALADLANECKTLRYELTREIAQRDDWKPGDGITLEVSKAPQMMAALQDADTLMGHGDAETAWREKWAFLWPIVGGEARLAAHQPWHTTTEGLGGPLTFTLPAGHEFHWGNSLAFRAGFRAAIAYAKAQVFEKRAFYLDAATGESHSAADLFDSTATKELLAEPPNVGGEATAPARGNP